MLRYMQRVLFCVLIVQLWPRTKGANVPFPKIDDIVDEMYKIHVTLTDQDQDATSFATEYYDQAENRGRLDAIVYGEKISIFHYNLTGDLLEVNRTACTASPADESEYYYEEFFHGWLHKDPLIIGPSALLWYAKDFTPDYKGTEVIRGVTCDYFEMGVADEVEELTYGYYFAAADWTVPYQIKGKRVPVRITVSGKSSRDSRNAVSVPVNQITDFSYITSDYDALELHPKIGLGCFGQSTDYILPKIPTEFRYSAEVYDLLKVENSVDTEAKFFRLWFSQYNKIARLDSFTRDSMKSNLYDFNNGVTYSVEDGQTCVIKPIQNSYFEKYDGMVGDLKTPAEIMGLIGDFYFMGHRSVRGINCRAFESARRDVQFRDDTYFLVVTTVFFSAPYTKVITMGEDMTQVPMFIQVTAYKIPNVVSFKVQYNIFGFDDVVGPMVADNFPIADCFPQPNQRSWFIIKSPVPIDLDRLLEKNNDMFINMIKEKIMDQTNISFVRLPYIKADYSAEGTVVTGMMLDRPPAMSTFYLMFHGPAKAEVKRIETANTEELCAHACIGETEFTCKGIHFCSGACYLNRRDYFEEELQSQIIELGICDAYIRSVSTSTLAEPYLPTALESLSMKPLAVDLMLTNETIEITFPDIIIGDGIVDTDVTDKSYNLIFYGWQLPSSEESINSVDIFDVNDENECFRACKDTSTMDCQSFSFCPGASNGKCRLSTLYVSKDMTLTNGVVQNVKGCNLYSLLNLDYFTAFPGKVSMVPGIQTFQKISVQECAVKCRKKDNPTCRGFEFCRNDRSCVLHDKHVMDYKSEKLVTTTSQCTHYAAKFIADYRDEGSNLIDDLSNPRTQITLEECARACSEEMPECKSFNFCPNSDANSDDSNCVLTTKIVGYPGVTTTNTPPCKLYTKRSTVEGYLTKKKAPDVDGYTQGSYAGVIIGTLIFGLIVGAGAFIGYSFYKSRKYSDGMTVKFMKQTGS